MRVAVPDLRCIDAIPGGVDQRMIGEARRKRRATGIPEALLGPCAPGRKAGEAGSGRADDDEAA